MSKENRLTPIKRVEDKISPSGKRIQRWLFSCSCGNTKVISWKGYKYNTTRSCGCISKEATKVNIGDTYYRLKVVSESVSHRKDRKKVFLCDCSCGNKGVTVVGTTLTGGKLKSCGCWRTDNPSNLKHGNYTNFKAEFSAYKNMISRCTKKHLKIYPSYGGRGITVCDRWLESFENFLEDMGERPTSKHSLDRIDNDQGYSLENCRWATKVVQNHNKRHIGNKTKSYRGVSYSKRDNLWCAKIAIDKKIIVLGYFKNEEDATNARKEGEVKYLPEVYIKEKEE